MYIAAFGQYLSILHTDIHTYVRMSVYALCTPCSIYVYNIFRVCILIDVRTVCKVHRCLSTYVNMYLNY